VALIPGNMTPDLLRGDSMLADLTDPDPMGSIKCELIHRISPERGMPRGKGRQTGDTSGKTPDDRTIVALLERHKVDVAPESVYATRLACGLGIG
jgi:hypothetical protein